MRLQPSLMKSFCPQEAHNLVGLRKNEVARDCCDGGNMNDGHGKKVLRETPQGGSKWEQGSGKGPALEFNLKE